MIFHGLDTLEGFSGKHPRLLLQMQWVLESEGMDVQSWMAGVCDQLLEGDLRDLRDTDSILKQLSQMSCLSFSSLTTRFLKIIRQKLTLKIAQSIKTKSEPLLIRVTRERC
jgi:hypothetical protein